MGHGARGAALFGAQAALYAAHRPSYPPELYESVLNFAGLADAPSRRRLAVDVATGSGQVATALAGACGFARVLACDSSQAQLAHAARHPNVEYALAPAERLDGVESGTVDLVTAAQSLHWFDWPAFYAEARRVLRSEGALAMWGYDLPLFSSPPGRLPLSPLALGRLRRALQELHTCALGGLWDDRRELVDNRYRGLEPGAEHFEVVQRLELSMHRDLSTPAVLGFLASWSAYATHRQRRPDAADPLTPFRAALLEATGLGEEGADSQEPVVRLEWPLFMILAKRPVLPA